MDRDVNLIVLSASAQLGCGLSVTAQLMVELVRGRNRVMGEQVENPGFS
jgi:hypothetical protein